MASQAVERGVGDEASLSTQPLRDMLYTASRGTGIDSGLASSPDARTLDPVRSAFQKLQLRLGANGLRGKDLAMYEDFLIAALYGDEDGVVDLIERLRNISIPLPELVQSAAVVAAREGHMKLLIMLLTKGAQLDRDLQLVLTNRKNNISVPGQSEYTHLTKTDEIFLASLAGGGKDFLGHLRAMTDQLGRPTRDRTPGFDSGNRFEDIDW